MSRSVSRAAFVCLGLLPLWGCAEPAAHRGDARVQPTYDTSTGRLRELTYDADANGRIETWTEMDGARPLRSRIDRNEDGRIDRWEHYDEAGALAKVGYSRADSGKADAWAYPGADGRVHRIELSSSADETRIDRREFYDPSRSDAEGRGALVRAEEDTTGDGRPDRWETYEAGAIRTVAFDENGDGIADRRLTYRDGRLVQIQSVPDGSGGFAKSVNVK